MPTFKSPTEQSPRNVPPGEYTFTVYEMETLISKGAKTAGSDVYKMKMTVDDHGVKVFDQLIDHESCDWKFGAFLKSCNVQLNEDEHFELIKTRADKLRCRWVNPVGLRGRFRLALVKKDKGEFNEVEAYLLGDPLPVETQPEVEEDVPW